MQSDRGISEYFRFPLGGVQTVTIQAPMYDTYMMFRLVELVAKEDDVSPFSPTRTTSAPPSKITVKGDQW
jgi:hypothetical protein